jgi:OmpA-OmpF porin, OOP family
MNFTRRHPARPWLALALAAGALAAQAQTSTGATGAADAAGTGPGGSSAATPPAGTPGSTITYDTRSPSGTMAQAGTSSGNSGSMGSGWSRPSDTYSLLPYTRRGYIGLNLGKPEFDLDCGLGFSCDDPNVGGYLYTGGMFNDWFGAEVGYLYTGKGDRAGGSTSAQGLNLSLVLRAPIGPVNAFAKAGGLYGQTRVSTDPLALDVSSGKKRGWGASYGLGVGFDFTPTSGVVLEWSRYELRFPGASGRDNVDMTSLGYVHKF